MPANTSITFLNGTKGIASYAFEDCTNLASVTIPNSVTVIDGLAFVNCSNLVSVTFQGTIPSSGFFKNAFTNLGDLRDKFYAIDATNGMPGTYTRAIDGTTWTKQP